MNPGPVIRDEFISFLRFQIVCVTFQQRGGLLIHSKAQRIVLHKKLINPYINSLINFKYILI